MIAGGRHRTQSPRYRRSMPLLTLPLALLAVLPQSGSAPDPALRAAPGLEARVAVAPGELTDPIALSWGSSGRLFVLERSGRVLRVGSWVSPYAKGLDGASGLVCWGDGVLVARAGGVDLVLDENADLLGPARRELVALPEGESLASLTLGPDGRVWAVRRVEGEAASARAGVVRFEPRQGASVELVAHVLGALGVDVMDDGEVLVTTEDAHVLELVVPEGSFPAGTIGVAPTQLAIADHVGPSEPGSGASVAEGEAPHGTAGKAGPVGGSELLGEALGPALEGARVLCVPGAGLVHADGLVATGVRFAATRVWAGELLTSRADGFRPVDAELGPMRELWVLDAGYGTRGARLVTLRVEGGPAFSVGDGRPDSVDVDLRGLETVELFDALTSSDPYRRRQAWRVLAWRGLEGSEGSELLRRARAGSDPHLWLPALWLTRDPGFAREALGAFEPAVRRAALRLALDHPELLERLPAAELSTRTRDGDGRVRLLALLCLASKSGGLAPRDLLDAFPRAEDDWTRSALLALAAQRPADLLAAIVRGGREAGLAPLVAGVADDVSRRGDLAEAVRMVLELRGAESVPHLAGHVLRRLSARFAHETPWPSPRLALVLRHLAESDSLPLAAASFPLAAGWLGERAASTELERWSARLTAVVTDDTHSLETRIACLESLLAVPSTRDLARTLAESHRGEPAWDRVLAE